MKKTIFLVCCFLIFACQDRHQKKTPQVSKQPNEERIGTTFNPQKALCFLSTVGSSKIQGKIVQDSLILQLEVNNTEVSGIYNWIPAEKDVRRGNIVGKKQGNTIRGEYSFAQEGKKQTQPIVIKLYDGFAKVTTNPGLQGKMVVEVEKTDCR